MSTPTVRTRPAQARQLPSRPDFAALLMRLAGRRGLAALDSAAGEPARWSWIGFEPREPDRDGLAAWPQRACELRAFVASGASLCASEVPGPFAGGFLGALSYDQGVDGEILDLAPDDWRTPALVGGFYTDFFVFDHHRDEVHLVLGADASPARWAELLELAEGATAQSTLSPRCEVRGPLRRCVSSARHRARIERARELIAQGEIYQANLAHPFEVETAGDPLGLYQSLRETNPAPYMGFLAWEGGALLSASPELLIEIEGRRLRTRPIKGTERRSSNPAEDRALAERLLASPKDRAELAMIVDLLRNDFGRVARPGSVRVEGLPTLRSYSGVHHLMADVHATLAEGCDAQDALLSAFPGGSITGAPKLRAMEAIAELEGIGRGVFSGSLGFFDQRGNARFNILIRTMQWRPDLVQGPDAGHLRYFVGGGITWGSDPAAEDRETLVKGAKLAESLGRVCAVDGGSEAAL